MAQVAPYREEDLESQYYIRFSNFVRGHGVFAARDLANGTVLGQYTGLLRQQVGDTDYAWQAYYKRRGDNGSGSGSDQDDFVLQIDSRSIGNAMRFVNDDRVYEKNCEVVLVHKKYALRHLCNLALFLMIRSFACRLPEKSSICMPGLMFTFDLSPRSLFFHSTRSNLWHVFYQINKPVGQDEEIFISYGENYWTSRVEH